MPSEWLKPANMPPLTSGGIQLWRYHTHAEDHAHWMAAARDLLAPGERERAERMQVPSARLEFVAARTLLRQLLGKVSGRDPRLVAFAEGPNGKPYLRGPGSVEFNVSHSGGLILIALSSAGRVGVDVEFINPAVSPDELLQIAQNTLNSAEIERMQQAELAADSVREFYRAWTRQEAVAKAEGCGIGMPPAYRLSAESDDRECRVSVYDSGGRDSVDYFVQAPDVGPDHLAALATVTEQQAVLLLDAQELLNV